MLYNTVLLCLYIHMNQLLVYIRPLPLNLPPTSHHVSPSRPSQQSTDLAPMSCSKFPLAYLMLHMIIHMFPCCCLQLSHPLLPTVSVSASPRLPSDRFISPIFLDSIYMCSYMIFAFLFLPHAVEILVYVFLTSICISFPEVWNSLALG